MKKLDLPGIYSEWLWEMGGSIPEYKKFIGMPYISNSQAKTFNSKSGFNTWKPGHLEWIQEKLLGYKFPDVGWGQFGQEVEGVICKEKGWEEYEDNFTEKELEVLNKVHPKDIQQRQVIVDLSDYGFVVLGYIDDMTKPDKDTNKIEWIIDYKTASQSSSKKLGNKDDFQLDIYNKGMEQMGYEVENLAYHVLDRGGGGELFKNKSLGRKALYIQGEIGLLMYELKDWDKVEKYLVDSARGMEKYYKVYKELIK